MLLEVWKREHQRAPRSVAGHGAGPRELSAAASTTIVKAMTCINDTAIDPLFVAPFDHMSPIFGRNQTRESTDENVMSRRSPSDGFILAAKG
jgi:hypothetical protein